MSKKQITIDYDEYQDMENRLKLFENSEAIKIFKKEHMEQWNRIVDYQREIKKLKSRNLFQRIMRSGEQ